MCTSPNAALTSSGLSSMLLDRRFYTAAGGRERCIALLAEPAGRIGGDSRPVARNVHGRPVVTRSLRRFSNNKLTAPWRGAKASALAPNPCSPSLNNLLRTISPSPTFANVDLQTARQARYSAPTHSHSIWRRSNRAGLGSRSFGGKLLGQDGLEGCAVMH